MATNGTTKTPVSGGSTGASTRGPRVGRLNRVADVARELRRIYRLSRSGELDTVDLGRLANTLQILVGILKTSDLEERIEALEQMNNGQQQP
jgi:hypothetical protein